MPNCLLNKHLKCAQQCNSLINTNKSLDLPYEASATESQETKDLAKGLLMNYGVVLIY